MCESPALAPAISVSRKSRARRHRCSASYARHRSIARARSFGRIGRADAQGYDGTSALLRESLGRRRCVERHTSAEQQKPEHAERVDLAAGIELRLAEHLLRRHEVRRAPRLTCGIDAEVAHGKRGDPEVDEANARRDVVVDRAGAFEQNILGLEIAVQHAFAVYVRERVGHLDEDSSEPRRRRTARGARDWSASVSPLT